MKIFFRKYRKKIIAGIAFLILVAAVSAAWIDLGPVISAFRHTAPQTTIRVTAVSVSTVNKPMQIVRTGTVGQSSTIAVNTEYTGRLSEIYVTEGQAVKAGQPLFRLEALPIEDKVASTTTNQNSGVTKQQQESYDSALKKFNNYQKLYELGGISRRELENAETALKEAQAKLADNRNASAASSAAILRGPAVIKAPTDGIVTALSATPGKAVQAGQPLMALGSGQEVEVLLRLEQSDLYLLPLGTPVMIEAAGQLVTGQVSSILPQIEEKQISFFLAHVKLADNPALLKPGMTTNVRIDSGKSSTVSAIPRTAVLQDEQGQTFVYTAVNGNAVRQSVNTGQLIGDFVEIIDDLPSETMVITNNLATINNGNAISVVAQQG